MKLSTIQEDIRVVNMWHQMIKDITNNTCMEQFLLSHFG